jgi:hypothetical protein
MIHRKITAAIILVIVCSALMLFSYINARNKADEFMESYFENCLYYSGTTFYPISVLEENHGIKQWYGPSWYISYDHQSQKLTEPILLGINLFGYITGITTHSLMEATKLTCRN